MKSFCAIIYLMLLGTVSGKGSAPQLLSALRESKISRIEVLYTPAHLESVAALSPNAVIARADHKVTIMNPSTAQHHRLLETAIERALLTGKTYTAGDAGGPSFRWACFFYGAKDERLFELYLDFFNDTAVIQNELYHVGPELGQWFVAVDKHSPGEGQFFSVPRFVMLLGILVLIAVLGGYGLFRSTRHN